MAELKAKVSTEKIIHNLMEKTAVHVMEEYGIKINSVDFQWIDEIGPISQLIGVEMRTTIRK